MKIIVKLLKFILIVALTVVIIGIAATKILSSTILDEAYAFRKLRASDYYNSIYEALKQNFENYIGPSGLEESVLDNICTIDDIQNDTETILGNIYEGTNKKVDTNKIQERLRKNITASLNETKATVESQKNIDDFVEQISNEYINTISHTDYEESINNAYQKANKVIKYAKKALGAGVLAIFIAIVLLNIKTLNRTFANLGISFASAGSFMFIGYYILNYKIKVDHLRVLNDSISTVLQSAVTDIFNQINSIGLILIIIGLVLIILGNILKKEK